MVTAPSSDPGLQREPRDMKSIHFGEASSLSGSKGTDKADGNSSRNC